MNLLKHNQAKLGAEAALTKVNRRIGASNILAPEDGVITSLDVTTPGQVIGAGQILATLVPISDELIIEAKLPPGDINYVSIGQKANVMLSAYDVRTYGKLIGEVTKSAQIQLRMKLMGINTIL